MWIVDQAGILVKFNTVACVSNITVSKAKIHDTMIRARIKTWQIVPGYDIVGVVVEVRKQVKGTIGLATTVNIVVGSHVWVKDTTETWIDGQKCQQLKLLSKGSPQCDVHMNLRLNGEYAPYGKMLKVPEIMEAA
ncbi:hypothetical protein Tco_0609152 [Tanacetum coccineum]